MDTIVPSPAAFVLNSSSRQYASPDSRPTPRKPRARLPRFGEARIVVRLKGLSKDLTAIKKGLLDKPHTPEYEHFRQAIRDEFLAKTLAILNKYLDLGLFEEVKAALVKGLK